MPPPYVKLSFVYFTEYCDFTYTLIIEIIKPSNDGFAFVTDGKVEELW